MDNTAQPHYTYWKTCSTKGDLQPHLEYEREGSVYIQTSLSYRLGGQPTE